MNYWHPSYWTASYWQDYYWLGTLVPATFIKLASSFARKAALAFSTAARPTFAAKKRDRISSQSHGSFKRPKS